MGRVVRISLVGMMLLAFPAPASAHDHRPPQATLRVGGFPWRGRLINLDWVRRTDDGKCVERHRRRELIFGSPAPAEVGHYDVRLRLLSPRRPRLRIWSWALVDSERKPVGPPEVVSYELEPLSRQGRTLGWEAVFRVTVIQHRYLAVRARWPDREGCDETQRILWTHHLRAI